MYGRNVLNGHNCVCAEVFGLTAVTTVHVLERERSREVA